LGVKMLARLMSCVILAAAVGCTDVTLRIDDPTPDHRYVVAFGDGTGGVFQVVPDSHYEIPWSSLVTARDLKAFDLEKDGAAVYPGTIVGWNVNVRVNTPMEPEGPYACDYYGSYGFVYDGVNIICPEGGIPVPG
jgi:hypothetical protein